MVAGVPDHPTVEHDRVRAPHAEPLVLAHLPQAELEEAHAALEREAVRQLEVERLRRALAIALEERLEELRRHWPELDQSQGVVVIGRRSSSDASVASSSFSKRSEKSARTLATCVFRASASFFFPSGVSTA